MYHLNNSILVFLFLISSLFIGFGDCDEKSHIYEANEDVFVWVNRVGPYRNPQEAYSYYSIPSICKPPNDHFIKHKTNLGESLIGYELKESLYKIKFLQDELFAFECQTTPTRDEVEELKAIIDEHYWYQFFIDDLPVWGTIGVFHEPSDKYYIFTSKHFEIKITDSQIVEVTLTPAHPTLIEPNIHLNFSYSVSFLQTKVDDVDYAFSQRFRKYLDYDFFEHQIHWFSLFNSVMMIVFLIGIVFTVLLKALKNEDLDEELMDGPAQLSEDSGWKQIHGDVFRTPRKPMLLCAFIGTGTQLLLIIFLVIFFSILGSYYQTRGHFLKAFCIIYAFTSFVAGYISGGLYAQNRGKHWIKALLTTVFLLPGIVVPAITVLNTIALAYNTLTAIPFMSMLVILVLFIFISFPLSALGTIMGRNFYGSTSIPCRINPFPHPIPHKKWHSRRWVLGLVTGAFPFANVFVEIFFIFSAFWQYKYYHVYGFLLLIIVLSVLITGNTNTLLTNSLSIPALYLTSLLACVSLLSTFYLLCSEDYRWQWFSFLSSSSLGLYIFVYSIYYYLKKTNMDGVFQSTYFFGYMALFSITIAILNGSVAFFTSNYFVRKLYQNIKMD